MKYQMQHMLQIPRWLNLGITLVLVGLIGYADYISGAQISFSVFSWCPFH